MSLFKIKKLLIFSVFFFFCCLVFLYSPNVDAAQNSPDIIGIRVYQNKDHLSAYDWYTKNVGVGAPQSLLIDGYEAVRDGRTVYVNATVMLSNKNAYTNIYVMSYNQSADNYTIDIFGKMLTNWTFNQNIGDDKYGKCQKGNTELETHCSVDSDCAFSEYCGSEKAKFIRDIKRYEIENTLNGLVEEYASLHDGAYPDMRAGSYEQHKTKSVWPSWQNTLAVVLGKGRLPIDPINYIECPDSEANQTTCWNEIDEKFNGDLNNSYIIQYEYDPVSKEGSFSKPKESTYRLCHKDGSCS